MAFRPNFLTGGVNGGCLNGSGTPLHVWTSIAICFPIGLCHHRDEPHLPRSPSTGIPQARLAQALMPVAI